MATSNTFWHRPSTSQHSPRSVRRTLRALQRSYDLFMALAFGDYVHSVGGPSDFDDGVVFSHHGILYKWCEPVPVVDPHQLLTTEPST